MEKRTEKREPGWQTDSLSGKDLRLLRNKLEKDFHVCKV